MVPTAFGKQLRNIHTSQIPLLDKNDPRIIRLIELVETFKQFKRVLNFYPCGYKEDAALLNKFRCLGLSLDKRGLESLLRATDRKHLPRFYRHINWQLRRAANKSKK